MNLNQQAEAFFTRFAEDFARADGALIAQRYGVPYMAVDSQGQARVFESRQQIGAYFQQVLDDYFRQGCRACRFRELQAQGLGRGQLFASLTWELTDAAGEVLRSWRESYSLTHVAGDWCIHSSVDHAD